MEDLKSFSAETLSTYLLSQDPQTLLSYAENYLTHSTHLFDECLNHFLRKTEETDPLYPKALLLSSISNKSSQPLVSLSTLQKILSISSTFQPQVFSIASEIFSLGKIPEATASLEKLIEISSGIWQAKYLSILAEIQPPLNSIEIYNNIWDIIYDLNPSTAEIHQIIRSDNDLLPDPLEPIEVIEKPIKAFTSKFVETWWSSQITETKSFVYIALLINDLRATLQKSVTADLMGIILTLGLMDELGVKFAQAGVQYSIEPLDNCFEIKVSGYGVKVLDATEKIMEFLYNSSPTAETVDQAMNLLKHQYSLMNSDPFNQSRQLRLAFLQHHQYLYTNKLLFLQNCLQTELNLSHVKVLMYACGWITCNQASDTSEFIEGLLFAAEGTKLKYLTPRTVTLLPNEIIELKQSSLNDSNSESVVEIYFQFSQASIEEMALTSVLELIINEHIHDTFHSSNICCRTISVSSRMTRGVSGILIKASSSETHPDAITQAVYTHIERILNGIDSMIITKRNQLIDIKKQEFKGVSEKSGFYWDEILQGNLEFERKSKEIHFLETLDSESFRKWLETCHLLTKALIVKVIAKQWGNVDNDLIQSFCKDVESFRNKYHCYSWLRIMH